MPRNPEHFGSALPNIAESGAAAAAEKPPKPKTAEGRKQTPEQKAQRMWDTYQDIKSQWVEFVRKGRLDRKNERRAKNPDAPVHIYDDDASLIQLRDSDNPIAKKFRATPAFPSLHTKLQKLWGDPKVQQAWRAKMAEAAEQWAAVNGSWEEYLTTHKEIRALEAQYDTLQKERFLERGKPTKIRCRTLLYDLVDVEMALEEARLKADGLSHKSPELAAKILDSELEERRREWQQERKGGFMWTRSMRRTLETIEDIVNNRNTLRLIVLEGEAGTGKTRFADALARWFTGTDALRFTVKKRTKAGREILADQTLEAGGGSPTVHQIVLEALTGKKRPTDTDPSHAGRVAFIEEFNRMENDEAGEVVTVLDDAVVGGSTRYGAQGANPDDCIQPNALVIAAQNPAGSRFTDRTDFTTEVKRKMTIVRLEHPPQTASNPELYEDFLVVLKNSDGNIVADFKELAPSWSEPQLLPDGKNMQAQLNTGMNDGGALWRMAQMLHQSYENLASRPDRPRKNVLTDENPEALLAGRVLTPGDVFEWLEEYKTEVKKGASLSHFLSGKFLGWLDSQFGSARDAGDRQLYLELAKTFGILTDAHEALPQAAITPRIILRRHIAELSPRVPRPIISVEGGGKLPGASEFPMIWIDAMDEAGNQCNRLAVRLEGPTATAKGRYVKQGVDGTVYETIGIIRECKDQPQLVDRIVLQEEARPERKIVVAALDGFERKEEPPVLTVPNAKNPYHKALAAGGIIEANLNPKRVDRTIDVQKILEECRALYQQADLNEWVRDVESADLNNLTADKRQMVEGLVKEGWEVIGVMPGRAAMVKEMRTAMAKLKPLWINASKNESVDDGYVWQEYYDNLCDTLIPQTQQKSLMGQALLPDELLVREWLSSIPERPHLLLTPPTQSPNNETCSLDVAGQRGVFVSKQSTMNQLRVLNPAETAVTQARFTRMAQEEAIKTGKQMTALDGLDKDTWSRFIDLPLSALGRVPLSGWQPDGRRVRFGWDVASWLSSGGGFRLAVRVEL